MEVEREFRVWARCRADGNQDDPTMPSNELEGRSANKGRRPLGQPTLTLLHFARLFVLTNNEA